LSTGGRWLCNLRMVHLMAETYLQIDASGKAVNLVVWDGNAPLIISMSHRLVKYAGEWGEGWLWDGTKCINPNPPAPPPPPAPAAASPSLRIQTI
jgi:hypothetical protein